MRTTSLLMFTLLLVSAQGTAQSILHPFSVVDGGGGTSSAGGFTLLGSAGQTAAGMVSDADTGIAIEGGGIPPLRQGGGTILSVDIGIQTAWNMISMPVLPPDPTKTVILPTAISSAFAYLPPPSGYAARDSLYPGFGYWVKFSGVETVPVNGTGLVLDTVPVNAGWNLLGSLSYPFLTSDVAPLGGVTILSSWFAFTGGLGYTSKDTIEPGRAYWVKVNQAGGVIMKTGSLGLEPVAPRGTPAAERPRSVADDGNRTLLPDGSALVFTDARGQARTVYVGLGETGSGEEMFELPPVPPSGLFDVRFPGDLLLKRVPMRDGGEYRIPLRISGAEWPVDLEVVRAEPGYTITLAPAGGGKSSEAWELSSEKTTLSRDGLYELVVRTSSSTDADLPTEFRLYQNHPNPFNPSTVVSFDLPVAGVVKLTISNTLGQTVREMSRSYEGAGRFGLRVDAAELPTGVYFYRLTTPAGTDMKKMVLLK